MTTPKISIVFTSYNHERWLAESIESVLVQTFPQWELLLVENGSTDGSLAIAETYAKNDPRIVLIRYDRNTPHTVVSNEAIRRARAPYLSFLYSDDFYLPGKLERQFRQFESLPEKVGLVYSSGYRLLRSGERALERCGDYEGKVLRQLLIEPQFFPPISPLLRTECLRRYPFNEKVFIEGEGVYFKVAMTWEFRRLVEPLVVMRDHESNAGKEIDASVGRNVIQLNDLFDHSDFPHELQHLRGHAIAMIYRLGGWQTIRRRRDYASGRGMLREAIRNDVAMRRDPRVIAGLLLASIPRSLANGLQSLANAVRGAPPPPIPGAETPVAGRSP